MNGRALLVIVSLAMVALDQAVKAWARAAMPPGGSVGGAPFPGFFELTLTYNKGVAFGLMQGAGVFMTPIALGIAGWAVWHSWRHPREGAWTHVSMALIAAGAVGNLIDRLWLGKVTDMFWFRAIDFPVFNVADACITVATIMLILSWGIPHSKMDEKDKRNPDLAPTPTAAEGTPLETPRPVGYSELDPPGEALARGEGLDVEVPGPEGKGQEAPETTGEDRTAGATARPEHASPTKPHEA